MEIIYNEMPSILLIYMCLHWLSVASQDCPLPDQPKHSSLTLFVKETTSLTAKYHCSIFLIDGNVQRTCDGGKWSGMTPRCAADISSSTSAEADSHRLVDQSLDSCRWYHPNSSLTFHLAKEFHLRRVTLISPINYKESLQSAEWSLHFGNQTLKRKEVFHETETSLATDQFSSIHWDLNDTVKDMTVALQGDVYLCEIFVHAYPDECGRPQAPLNGGVDWIGDRADYYCNTCFQLSSESRRYCVHGRWTGRSPSCESQCSMMICWITPIALCAQFIIIWLIRTINTRVRRSSSKFHQPQEMTHR